MFFLFYTYLCRMKLCIDTWGSIPGTPAFSVSFHASPLFLWLKVTTASHAFTRVRHDYITGFTESWHWTQTVIPRALRSKFIYFKVIPLTNMGNNAYTASLPSFLCYVVKFFLEVDCRRVTHIIFSSRQDSWKVPDGHLPVYLSQCFGVLPQ